MLTDDFSQAEEDCRQEMYSGRTQSPMPWGNRYDLQDQWQSDSISRLENLIKEETEEIEQSRRYLRHADVSALPKRKGFWELTSKHRNRVMSNISPTDTENLDPDVAAAMMASEEQGQVLKHIPPAALFNRLFPEDNRKCTMLIRGASKYHRDYVVPERGAMRHGDCLMSDVDAGILPYGEMMGVHKDDDLPIPMYHPDQSCPDGICESSKKQAKVNKLKATRVDEEDVELSWVSPTEDVKGFQVYYAPVSHGEKKGSTEWKSMYVSTPKYDLKWNSLDPKAEAVHFAVSPIVGDSPPPDTPSKDATKLDVKRPKTKGKTKHLKQPAPELKNVQVINAAGGVELEWETPPNTREGALIEYKSGAHTKMQYKATRENHVFLPVPEKQGKLYVALQPRSSGFETVPIVELLWDMKQGKIITMQVDEKEDEDPKRYYTVSSLPPLTGNFIQLRGSQPPPWFPGYFTVQPGIAQVIPLDEPHKALEKAWVSMGPSQVNSPHGNFLLGKS